MTQIPGIYVEIKGDSTQLRKDLQSARQIVTESAKGMSNALNNALSPAQISKGTSSLIANLGTMSRSTKLAGDEFKKIGVDLRELQRVTGVTAAQFQTLQSKLLATQAAKAQESALRGIATAARLTETEIRSLGVQFGLSNAQIKNVTGGAQQAGGAMTLLGGAARAALAYLSVTTVFEFGKAVLDTGIKIDSLQRSFVALTGSTAGMEAEFSFMKETAAATGQNMYALADSYKQLTASTQGTILEGQKTRDLFVSMSEASAVLGLSNERVELSMKAFAQMAAKGVVQMEELKNQLGDSLPGAVNIAARAMGVSQAALMKMSAAGKLLATDLLPKMSAELHKMYGAAANTAGLQSGQAAVNRLSQEWTEFKANLYDNEGAVRAINGIKWAIQGLSDLIDPTERKLASLWEEKARIKSSNFFDNKQPGDDLRLKSIGEEIAQLQAAQNVKLANEGKFLAGWEKQAIDSANKMAEIRGASERANIAHKDSEYRAYSDIEEAGAVKRQASYEANQKAAETAIGKQGKAEGKAYDALAENRKRLSEEVTDALATAGMTQTEQAKYQIDKQYAADLALAGKDIALAAKVTEAYQLELAKRTKSDNDWTAFTAKQHLAAAEKIKDGWQVAAEGRAKADEIANERIAESTVETSSVITEEFSRAFESVQSSLADMIYEFDFSMDSILDIFKRMLAQMAAAIIMSGVKQAFLNMIDGDSMTTAWGGLVSGVMGSVGKGAGSGGAVDTSGAASGWGKVGGGLAVAGGAYGMYSGAQNYKNGNKGVGAVQMGVGAYSTYQGAVTLGMIEKGTATGVAKGMAAKFGYGTAVKGGATVAGSSAYTAGSGATSYGTFQTAASTGGSAAGGSSAGIGAGAAGAAAYAIPIAAAVLVAVSAYQKSQRPQAENQIDEAGITPANLTGFYDGMRGIQDSILATIPTLTKYETAMYDQNTGLLVATGAVGTIALKYNEAAAAGNQWSLALGVGGEAMRSNIIAADQFSASLGVSAEGMGVAAEIAYSEKESMDVLSAALLGMGESAYSVAGTVAGAAESIKSAYASLNSINYDDPDKNPDTSATVASYSGHIVNPSGTYSPNLEYHASGGVFTGQAQMGRHVFGESGMEALIPLPNGFKDLSDVISRLNRIEAKQSNSGGFNGNVQVFIGDKELHGEIRVVTDRVIADRQAQGSPTGSVYI